MTRFYQVALLLVLCISLGAGQGKGKGKPKPPPEPVIMGILFFDGFERRSVEDATTNHPWHAGGNGSTGTVRTGIRSHNADGGLTNPAACRNYNFDHAAGDSFFNEPSVYLSFYLRRTGSTTDDKLIARVFHTDGTAGNAKLSLFWASGGALKVTTATGTTTGSTSLNVDQWYRIDLQVNTGISALWELRIDNSVEVSANEDLSANNMTQFTLFQQTSNPVFIDDVVLRDDAYHADGDDFRVETIFPNGDGNYTSWTGTWTDVDEKSSDANESTTDTNTNRETYTLESIPALSGNDTIDAAMVVATVRKTAGGAVNCQIIERESSTDRDTVNFLVEDNTPLHQTYRWLIQTTKPSGGAWTESAVNGYEVGLEHNQSQARDIFLNNINVNVLISTTATSTAKAGKLTLLGVQ